MSRSVAPVPVTPPFHIVVTTASSSSVPPWMVAVLTTILLLIGSLATVVITRLGARELDRRSKRELLSDQIFRAAELAVSNDPRVARLGMAALQALAQPGMPVQDKAFLAAVIDSITDKATHDIGAALDSNALIDVIIDPHDPEEGP